MKRGGCWFAEPFSNQVRGDGRESEWGYVSMSACPDGCGFIFPQKVPLSYANVGLTDITEVAVNVVVVGLGGPEAKDFDGVFSNSLSRGSGWTV